MPPKRKKTAKTKLANMTEEERTAYLQQQLLKEEQAKKQKEDLLSIFLKEKVANEQKSNKHNIVKLEGQWRKIMRELKSKSLKKETEDMMMEFHRQMDRRDALTKSLADDLEQSEEQQMMRMRRYAESVNDLIALQGRRLIDLEAAFEEELGAIENEFDSERDLTTKRHQKDLSDEADIRFCMRTKFRKEEDLATAEFQTECDEMKNKNLEDKHSLRLMLEEQLSKMWSIFQEMTKDYQECTHERRQQFDALKERDLKLTREIEDQGKRLQDIERKIEMCRKKLKCTTQVSADRQKMLKEQKSSLLSQYQDMKGFMTQFSQAEMKKLKRLCAKSEECLKKVDDKTRIGEQVLEMAELCRHYETEEEKVLPFYGVREKKVWEREIADAKEREPRVMERLEEQRKLATTVRTPLGVMVAADVVSSTKQHAMGAKLASRGVTGRVEYDSDAEVPKEATQELTDDGKVDFITAAVLKPDHFEKFWMRFNKVKLEEMALGKELRDARERNAVLKSSMTGYLDSISVPKDLMDKPNPLLVVTQKPAIYQGSPRRMDGHARIFAREDRRGDQKVVIEAAHTVHCRSLSLA